MAMRNSARNAEMIAGIRPRLSVRERGAARLYSNAVGARAWMGEAGEAFCAAHRGATARTMTIVARLIAGR